MKFNINRKTILLSAAVVGLVAVPSLVVAGRNNSNSNREAEVRQEDQISNDNHAAKNDDNPKGNEAVASDNVKVEREADVPAGSITTEQAINIAKTTFPNGQVRKVEIEVEHGVTVYSVRFTDDSRVDVRASDGQVVRKESKNGDDNSSRHGGNDDSGGGNSGRDHAEDN